MASAQAPPLEQERTGRPPPGQTFTAPRRLLISSAPGRSKTFPSRVRRMNDKAVMELSLCLSTYLLCVLGLGPWSWRIRGWF